MKLSCTQKILAGVACAALYSIPLATINGAFDIFLKTESGGTATFPDGESTGGSTGEYNGWIDIESFSIGGSNDILISSTTKAIASLDAMSVSMPVGQTSPAFFQTLTSGATIGEIKLALRNPIQSEQFMGIYLKNVYVESVSWSGSGGDSSPSQSVSLVYEAIKVEYTAFDFQTETKTVTYTAEWDLKSNAAKY